MPIQRLPAKERYKNWPGLQNPRQQDPVEVARDVWDAARVRKRLRRLLHIGGYRSLRVSRAALRALAEEITSAPKRSIAEILLGLPIALLPVDPYREWLLKWPIAWNALLVLVVLNFLYGLAWRVNEKKESAKRIAQASAFLQLIIECSRPHTRGGQNIEPTEDHLRHTISVFLQAVADLVQQVLQVPSDVRVYANLMIPMSVRINGDAEARDGIGIVAYCLKRPADPAWTRVPTGDLGAGEAMVTGKIQVLEDTGDPRWCGVFAKTRSSCFASFPVLEGSGKAIAVVNVDADRSHVLNRKNAGTELYQTLVGPLSILADILHSTATATTRRRGGARK